MTCEVDISKYESMIEQLITDGMDGVANVLVTLLNEAMKIDRSRHIQARAYERSDYRDGYANGYKPKTVQSRLGKLEVQVPQVRASEQPFYPASLEKGLRSERALKAAIAEMYIQGVSTRRVQAITKELCGFEVSSSQVSRVTQELDKQLDIWRNQPIGEVVYLIIDARYEKVRYAGKVIDNAVLTAYGVNPNGEKRILGTSVSLSENEVHWRQFLESLVSRGMHGLKLVISDAHSGLKAARKAVFPSVPWQRCQFHLQQNAQAYVPKKSMKETVASNIRDVFNAPSLDDAKTHLAKLIKKYESIAPELSQWMEENIQEGLTIFSYPREHWKKMRTSNLAERCNKEIKRRTKVVGIFPNMESCLRLISAILMEIDEEWIQGRRYLRCDIN